MLTIYHNPRCSKSRETLKLIEEAGSTVEVVEYLKTPPSRETLVTLIDKLGVRPELLIRKGEKIYKEEYKGQSLTDEQWIDAMVKHPVLIERPIVVDSKKAVIGRPPQNVIDLIS